MCFVKMPRNILNNEWAKKANTLALFCYLYLKAEYKDGEVLKRGQVMTTLPELSAALGLTIKEVRTALKNLERADETAHGRADGRADAKSIITICKYDSYTIQKIVQGQTEGQTIGQTEGQMVKEESLPPNNIYNNPLQEEIVQEDKEEKENNIVVKESSRFRPPSLQEVIEYFISKGSNANEAEQFFLHYEANGWMTGKTRMKLWRSAASGWIKRDYNHNNRPTTKYERAKQSSDQLANAVAESCVRDFEQEQRGKGGADDIDLW